MTTADAIVFGLFVAIVIATLISGPETTWSGIVFVIDWTFHQIIRPVDWLFRRYWP